jgi:GDPmannose 4,6-dehydratase
MDKQKVAVITGVEGQDGSWLAEYLIEEGYKVVGVSRRKSTQAQAVNLDLVSNNSNFRLVRGDIVDPTLINDILQWYKPDEFFNLAAMSHVGQSFKEPLTTLNVNAGAVMMALESIRMNSPKTRFYQASTSELFGGLECPKEGYTEHSPFHPRSPYGVAKLAAYWAVVNCREAYGIFACNGILHNHESTRRGLDFAPRKITAGVAAIVNGKQKTIKMGNMEAYRDIGHAKDYIKAMHLMLQQDKPEDFLIATGEAVSIREMVEYVCELAGRKYDDVYEMNEKYMRPSDVPYLKGNPAKAKSVLGWEPEYDWKALLKEMYEHDLKR